MVRLEYSQIVRRKLNRLKRELIKSYGEEKARAVLGDITRKIRRLETFPKSGTAVSSLYDVECDYFFIWTGHNYFFYQIKDSETVLVLEMFSEKEDFMRKLFGIITTSKETIDYWKE